MYLEFTNILLHSIVTSLQIVHVDSGWRNIECMYSCNNSYLDL